VENFTSDVILQIATFTVHVNNAYLVFRNLSCLGVVLYMEPLIKNKKSMLLCFVFPLENLHSKTH